MKKEQAEKLNEELFKCPTAEYRGIPFWSWNCKVTEKMIDWQLECFVQMGFGGVDVHPRTGLDIEYLGEEYMHLIEYTVKRCKEKGLYCWLYDEDRFPSGVAGGMVTQDFRLRGRFLLLTEKHQDFGILSGYCEDKEHFEAAVAEGKKPQGYYMTAYEMVFWGGCLKEYRRLKNREEIRQALAREGRVRFAYVKIMGEEEWFENQAYVDTMNPEAVARFIQITHESYYKKVGKEFGRVVPAIFTDEPRMGKHTQISCALSDEDVTIPYSEYLAAEMNRKYKTDLLDIVPEYVWELADEKYSINRYRYRETAAECFAKSFLDQIGDWCKEHGIAMTGHILGEDTLSGQSVTVGDCMRCYRNMDFPGIDVLLDRREFITAKQVVSIARQNGKKGVVSELYGVTHWDCDFATYKMQGDWQAALGITIRIPHLSYMSMKGEAKRDWPASIFYQSPWYEEFPYIENYFARLNTVLTRGKAVVKAAVLHPVESIWMYFGPENQTGGIRKEMDRDLKNLTEWMLYGLIDFDFLSESMLPEQCQAKRQNQELLAVGEMEYSIVIVPGLTTIRSTTLDILEEFNRRGGKIIFMGKVPDLEDGRRSCRACELAEKCLRIQMSENELLSALEEERILEILDASGRRADNLFYQMREEGNRRWLYICHANRKSRCSFSPEIYRIIIKGEYTVVLYDAMTGDIKEIAAVREAGYTILKKHLYGEDSVLLCFEEHDGEAVMSREGSTFLEAKNVFGKEHQKNDMKFEKAESFIRDEPNAFLLDYAEYQIDDGPIFSRQEILKADNEIRKQLGFVPRRERMNQPWFMQEKQTHTISLYYTFYSEVEVKVWLAMEDSECSKVTLNGKPADMSIIGHYVDPAIKMITLPLLKKGENYLKVELGYNQKSGLENMFLLGDFDVELQGTRAVIKDERTKIRVGDITRQGMPFYTGNLDYFFQFKTEETSSYKVHIPHFSSPVLAVYLDGVKKGLIAYAPHSLDLGQVNSGSHKLIIRLYGNRFNGFGTLHNANEDFIWYGPDAYRTEGDEWTDCYLVRPVGILAAVELQKII